MMARLLAGLTDVEHRVADRDEPLPLHGHIFDCEASRFIERWICQRQTCADIRTSQRTHGLDTNPSHVLSRESENRSIESENKRKV